MSLVYCSPTRGGDCFIKKAAYPTDVPVKALLPPDLCSSMNNKPINYRPALIYILLGAAAGWSYWKFAGCASGTCAIASSPVNSSIYGALMGLLLAGWFKKEKPTKNSNLKEQWYCLR